VVPGHYIIPRFTRDLASAGGDCRASSFNNTHTTIVGEFVKPLHCRSPRWRHGKHNAKEYQNVHLGLLRVAVVEEIM
jgi:hypothetical protein